MTVHLVVSDELLSPENYAQNGQQSERLDLNSVKLTEFYEYHVLEHFNVLCSDISALEFVPSGFSLKRNRISAIHDCYKYQLNACLAYTVDIAEEDNNKSPVLKQGVLP